MASEQISVLEINGDELNGFVVLSSSLSFSGSGASVVISVVTNFNDTSTIFNWWLNSETASLKLTYSDIRSANKSENKLRTIQLEGAVCTAYTESFNGSLLPDFGMAYPVITISVEAETISMGETNYPPA